MYTLTNSKKEIEHTDVHNVHWKIPKFSELMSTETIGRNYLAPKNTVVDVPDSKFQIKMSIFGSDGNIFGIHIYYLSKTAIFLEAELEISFIKDINIVKNCHALQANLWQFIGAIEHPKNRSSYHPNLDVYLKFIIYREAKVDCCNVPQLADDFRKLLTDDSHSDVTMVSAEGDEFKVHKNILSIRSKVLKAHFEHNTSESLTNIVKTTWATEVLRELLTFVYTNKAPHVDDYPDKLLAAADYYQLEGMKTLCEDAVRRRLTVENAIDTLQLAEMHSANSLRDSTLEFIKHGRAKLITESTGWANISKEFMKIIYEYITADEIDNSDILASAINELNLQK